MNRSQRSALAKFRAGVSPFQLELGRYTGQPLEERICPMCETVVETEYHVLVDCVFYSDITGPLHWKAALIYDNYKNITSFEKFCILVSNENLQYMCAKIF